MTQRDVRWSVAMADALYGPSGFYRRERPADHFRTSVHASAEFAAAIAQLIVVLDHQLGAPSSLDVVDVGAGEGELLSQLAQMLPESVDQRTRLVGVEIRSRPDDLDGRVQWRSTIPEGIEGLLIANEWLDNQPVDVVSVAGPELRYLLVDPLTGEETVGGVVDEADLAWLSTWWPQPNAESGSRLEVGRARDTGWLNAVSSISRGLAVAIDYSHLLEDRQAGRFDSGTLTGFRHGRAVAAIPDGSCDVTAYVALDACLVAGEEAGAEESLLTSQRRALLALGVSAERPPLEHANSDPVSYALELSRASHAAELIDRDGLGGFGWLIQAKRTAVPETLKHTS